MEIRWYADILQRRKWVVVLTTFMAVAVAGLGSYLMTPVYSASTVVRIDTPPRVNGYLSERNRTRVAGSAWLLVSAQGQGNVVLFADDPAHRKYWHGTDRLLINAIFFGNLVNPSKARG